VNQISKTYKNNIASQASSYEQALGSSHLQTRQLKLTIGFFLQRLGLGHIFAPIFATNIPEDRLVTFALNHFPAYFPPETDLNHAHTRM
jgi:hypothetical protein